ncbi:hypothetical protein CHS0354_017009 [Potamilus streckersoni]|uniref:Uncharacterized protein n=1 Tax=Potamilus streckersoni TaxID=2493646 RepID=A0AAE0S869_9BIVA|nr:hypothetical protein CHS0354_017009 [Potamilus streckersoni]
MRLKPHEFLNAAQGIAKKENRKPHLKMRRHDMTVITVRDKKHCYSGTQIEVPVEFFRAQLRKECFDKHKQRLTVMFFENAAGHMMPTFHVFPIPHIRGVIRLSGAIPEGNVVYTKLKLALSIIVEEEPQEEETQEITLETFSEQTSPQSGTLKAFESMLATLSDRNTSNSWKRQVYAIDYDTRNINVSSCTG